MAGHAGRALPFTNDELRSLEQLLHLPRERVELGLTREALHRWTLPQLKTISIALAGRLPPRFTLRGTKAVQVGQLATALWDTPMLPGTANVNTVLRDPPPIRSTAVVPTSLYNPFAPYAQCIPTLLTILSAPPAPANPLMGLSSAEIDLIRHGLHPFYEEVSLIAAHRVSALRVANSSHHQLRFHVDPPVFTKLDQGKGAYALLIRFFKDTNDVQWWNDFHVILNGKTVDTRQLQKKIRTNPKYTSFVTPYPADIGPRIVSGSNLIEFYYHNWATTNVLVIEFVRRRQPTDLVALVPGVKGSAAFVPSASGEDIEELKQVLSLNCPITMLRMQIPAKGRQCSHIQAFDLKTYIDFCNNAQVWNCPICQKTLPFHQLVRDELINSILGATGKEVESVDLAKDGTWTVGSASEPIDAGDSDSDQPAKRPHAPENGARKVARIDATLRPNGGATPAAATATMQQLLARSSVPAKSPGSASIIVIDSD